MSWAGEVGDIVKYNHWPNPFSGLVANITVLACEGTWQAMFTMYAYAYANWFWSNFVPSPFELTRKTFTGAYKCGFYSKYRVKSPLDIIWRDGSASRSLGSIIGPVTKASFYIWAGQTIWDALQTWQSLEYAMEMCDWDGNTTTIANSSAPLQIGHKEGGPAFGEAIYDPKGRAVEAICEVQVLQNVKYQMYQVGYVISNGHTITNIKSGFTVNNEVVAIKDHGTCQPGGIVEIFNEYAGPIDFLVCQPWLSCDVSSGPVGPSLWECTRFIVNAFPPAFDWEPNQPIPVTVPGDYPQPLCHYYE